MPNTLRSVISLSPERCFTIPRPFGDLHRLVERGNNALLLTPWYSTHSSNNRLIQFPHALIVNPETDIGKLLLEYVPPGNDRPRRIDEILKGIRTIPLNRRMLEIPWPIATVMNDRKNRTTAILLPRIGIDLQFTERGVTGGHPNLWNAVQHLRTTQ